MATVRLIGAEDFKAYLGQKLVTFGRGKDTSVHPRYVPVLLKYRTVSDQPLFEHLSGKPEKIEVSFDQSEEASKKDKLSIERKQAIHRKRHKLWEEKKGLSPEAEALQKEPEEEKAMLTTDLLDSEGGILNPKQTEKEEKAIKEFEANL